MKLTKEQEAKIKVATDNGKPVPTFSQATPAYYVECTCGFSGIVAGRDCPKCNKEEETTEGETK